MAIIADTGGILVILDQDDPRHHRALEVLDEPIIVPSIILPEVDYLASTRLPYGTNTAFLKSLLSGDFEYLELSIEDIRRAEEIMNQYDGARVGLVDAAVVAVAERLKINRILTVDHRHFSLFKPKGLGYLELLP